MLLEYGKSLKSKELAIIAQDKKLVAPSMAKDPIQSISQALERNIRLNKGNKPKLIFVETDEGHAIAMPEWDEEKKIKEKAQKREIIQIDLGEDMINKIRLYQTSFNLSSIEHAIVELTKKGLAATSKELIDRLKVELERLDQQE